MRPRERGYAQARQLSQSVPGPVPRPQVPSPRAKEPPLSPRSPHRAAAVIAALAASLALAPAALAGTVATGHACYVAAGIGEGATIDVSGSGFTPGEEVFAQIPAPGGLLGYSEATVGPDGSLSASIPSISPETIDPVVEKRTLQIKGILSGAILAEAPFKLTNLAVRTKPLTAPLHRKVTYRFTGFRPGRPIFAHYLRRKHVVLTHKFGRAKGACGVLTTKAPLFPGRGGNHKYKVQFDAKRKYSAKTAWRIVTSLSTF